MGSEVAGETFDEEMGRKAIAVACLLAREEEFQSYCMNRFRSMPDLAMEDKEAADIEFADSWIKKHCDIQSKVDFVTNKMARRKLRELRDDFKEAK